MPPWVISLMFALGAGTWIYSQMFRRTGGNTTNALAAAGVSGLLLFMLFYFFLKAVESWLG